MSDTNSIVFAGGSVLAAIIGTTVGDVDILLCCNQDEAIGITSRVFEAVQTLHKQCHGQDTHLLVTRGTVRSPSSKWHLILL